MSWPNTCNFGLTRASGTAKGDSQGAQPPEAGAEAPPPPRRAQQPLARWPRTATSAATEPREAGGGRSPARRQPPPLAPACCSSPSPPRAPLTCTAHSRLAASAPGAGWGARSRWPTGGAAPEGAYQSSSSATAAAVSSPAASFSIPRPAATVRRPRAAAPAAALPRHGLPPAARPWLARRPDASGSGEGSAPLLRALLSGRAAGSVRSSAAAVAQAGQLWAALGRPRAPGRERAGCPGDWKCPKG